MGGRECCGLNFTKNVLNVFNIVFLLAGVGILTVAVWTIADRFDYVALLPSSTYPMLVYFLLAAAVLVVLVAFMGCYAVLKEQRPLLLCYIFLLLLIFLIEAMVGIVAYIYKENVHADLVLNLNATLLATYNVDEEKTKAVDFLQENFHCCGAESFADWKYSEWLQTTSTNNLVPDTCCKTVSKGCGISDHPSNINYAGCLYRMSHHLDEHLSILSAVGLGICVLQIFGIVFAFKLFLKLKNFYNVDNERSAFF